MVFSSTNFLTIFLPLFLFSYYFVEAKYKNICVLLYSIAFYAYGCIDNPHYIVILIISLVVNFIFGILLEKIVKHKKFILLLAIFFNVGVLFVFKYHDFAIDIINHLFRNIAFTKLNLVLPIGISFYTFQILSYILDVYFGKISAEKNFINLSTYIIMFPQLIAGPIIRYSDIKNDIESDRRVDLTDLLSGLKIFIFGLGSKIIIANQLSGVQVDISAFEYDMLSASSVWLSSIAYGLQIYFDFYGYSLMAIGLGKMMGVNIMKNFDDPFISTSVSEFWRRWHISLGTWFKDYILYPILMSKSITSIRKFLTKLLNKNFASFVVNTIAIFVVWFTTGLWHGAAYNFILWGLYFFVFMEIEQMFLYKFMRKHKFIGHIYLIIAVIISFTIFSNEDMTILKYKLLKMWEFDNTFLDEQCIRIFMTNIKSIILGILFATTIPKHIYRKVEKYKMVNVICIIIVLSLSIYLIYKGSNDPFMYFRF